MRKILPILGIMIIIISIKSVKALENKLYFIEQDNKLVYESDSEDYFMKHMDMIPGSSYQDELEIENGTKNKYTLYLKVDVKEQSELADELLENIMMKVYLDDTLIYSGKTKGIDYQEEGINLQDAVKLKEFSSGDKSLLRVETQLVSSYSNKDNSDIGKVDWIFYAQYENNKPQIINNVPKTSLNSSKTVISIITLILGVIIIGVYFVRKNNFLREKEV